MIQLLREIRNALVHLAYPHVCEGCGTDVLQPDHRLCLVCLSNLPATHFQFYPNNPVEKIFWGRLPLHAATAQYYFSRDSLIQRLMHQVKYRGNRDLAIYLGKRIGTALTGSNRFASVDVVVPLPLNPLKERRRGYNQAALLCEGISGQTGWPVSRNAVVRTSDTESQTRKNRIERWQNMEGQFRVEDGRQIRGKHILLVDDVVTTGATLEACGHALLQEAGTRLSVASLCFSAH
ncbi:MAG TPA: ComF family protein [Flavisolibacter sp.]